MIVELFSLLILQKPFFWPDIMKKKSSIAFPWLNNLDEASSKRAHDVERTLC